MPAAITPVTINSYSVVSKTAYKGGTKPEQKQSASDFKQVSAAERRGRSSRKQSQVLNQLGSKAASLESFIKSTQFPSGTSAPLFRTASVSDPDKATASAADGADTAVYTLDITRPASAQTRSSSVLTSNAPSDIAHGTHAFELTAGDTAHSLSIAVDTEGRVPDTNKDVLERLAAVIGGTDDSIDATVIEGERNAWSTASDTATETIAQLNIRARDSGTSADFSLTDTDGSSLLAKLGLGSGAGTAANAAYALNAVAAESTGNTVRTDSGRLEIQLLETTGDTPVSINVQGGLDPLDAHLTARIGAYNHFANWVEQNSAYINTAFIDELTNDISQSEEKLRTIGISLSDDGSIAAGDDFTAALKTDSNAVARNLAGPDGLFTKILDTLDAVLTGSPESYAGHTAGTPAYRGIDLYA